MKDLSIGEEYIIMMINNKGKFNAFDPYGASGFFAAALVDLLISGEIELVDKNKLQLTDKLITEHEYYSDIKSVIGEKGKIKINTLVSKFTMRFTNKKLYLIVNKVLDSLERKNYVINQNNNIMSDKNKYIVKNESIDYIVQKIRAEILEEGDLTEQTIALASLLAKNNKLKRYFSKYESKQLKIRIKEIKNSPSNKVIRDIMSYLDAVYVAAVISAT